MSPWSCIRPMITRATLVLSLAATALPARAGLVGNDLGTGTLYNVDPLTGAASDPRSTGVRNLAGIAYGPGGDLYGLNVRFGTPTASALYRIDPTTGASSLVGATGLPNLFEGDLGFDRTTGILYGVGEDPVQGRDLFTMNTATGKATIVGSMESLGDPSAVAFDKAGRLFVLDDNHDGVSELLEVDKSDASVISSVTLSLRLGPVSGMSFDPATGVFYVVDGTGPEVSGTNSLYTLNTTTGVLTLVGNTGLSSGLAGLASSAAAVPEPSTCVLLGLGIVGLWVGFRRSARSQRARVSVRRHAVGLGDGEVGGGLCRGRPAA